jgi:hypothetical protein
VPLVNISQGNVLNVAEEEEVAQGRVFAVVAEVKSKRFM